MTQLAMSGRPYAGDFNSTSKKPMQLVLFLFALEHVVGQCRLPYQTHVETAWNEALETRI